jgi:hypothetical protein
MGCSYPRLSQMNGLTNGGEILNIAAPHADNCVPVMEFIHDNVLVFVHSLNCMFNNTKNTVVSLLKYVGQCHNYT